MRLGSDEGWEIWKRGRKGEFLVKRTKTRGALCFWVTVVERNNKAMAVARCVDQGVIELMLFDVMKVCERFAKKEIEGSIHDKKVYAKMKGNGIVIRVECL